jgi:hypothetical protein
MGALRILRLGPARVRDFPACPSRAVAFSAGGGDVRKLLEGLAERELREDMRTAACRFCKYVAGGRSDRRLRKNLA